MRLTCFYDQNEALKAAAQNAVWRTLGGGAASTAARSGERVDLRGACQPSSPSARLVCEHNLWGEADGQREKYPAPQSVRGQEENGHTADNQVPHERTSRICALRKFTQVVRLTTHKAAKVALVYVNFSLAIVPIEIPSRSAAPRAAHSLPHSRRTLPCGSVAGDG